MWKYLSMLHLVVQSSVEISGYAAPCCSEQCGNIWLCCTLVFRAVCGNIWLCCTLFRAVWKYLSMVHLVAQSSVEISGYAAPCCSEQCGNIWLCCTLVFRAVCGNIWLCCTLFRAVWKYLSMVHLVAQSSVEISVYATPCCSE